MLLAQFLESLFDALLVGHQLVELLGQLFLLLLERLELLVGRVGVVLDADCEFLRRPTLFLPVVRLKAVFQHVPRLHPKLLKVERVQPVVGGDPGTKPRDRAALKSRHAGGLNGQRQLREGQIVVGRNRHRHPHRFGEGQVDAGAAHDDLRRLIGNRHVRRLIHRLAGMPQRVLQFDPVLAGPHQGEPAPPHVGPQLRQRQPFGHGQLFHDPEFPRQRPRAVPDRLASKQREGHSLQRLAGQPHEVGGNLEAGPLARGGNVSQAPPAGGLGLTERNLVGPPVGAVFPVLPIMPFQHDGLGDQLGHDVDMREEGLAGPHHVRLRSVVEQVAVQARLGRVGVGVPQQQPEVPFPGPLGMGSLGNRLGEPDPLDPLGHRLAMLDGLQQLDLTAGHLAGGRHLHFDLALLGPSHRQLPRRILARLGQFEILRQVQQRPGVENLRPVDHGHRVRPAPGPPAMNAILKRLFESREGEVPTRGVFVGTFEVVPQRGAFRGGNNLDLQAVGFSLGDRGPQVEGVSPQHRRVSRDHVVPHPRGGGNVGQGLEDAGQRGWQTVAKQRPCPAQRRHRHQGRQGRPPETAAVDHCLRLKRGHPRQGLGNQPAVEGGRHRRGCPGLVEIDHADEAVVNARQVRLDEPGDSGIAQPAEQRAQHPGIRRNQAGNNHQRQSRHPPQRPQRHRQVEQRDRHQKAHRQRQGQSQPRRHPTGAQQLTHLANQSADGGEIGGSEVGRRAVGGSGGTPLGMIESRNRIRGHRIHRAGNGGGRGNRVVWMVPWVRGGREGNSPPNPGQRAIESAGREEVDCPSSPRPSGPG